MKLLKNENKYSVFPSNQAIASCWRAIALLAFCFVNSTVAAAPRFQYLQIAGSTFHPLDSDTTYSYNGGGCISKTGGTHRLFAHKVILPEGAKVKYLRLYAYDDTTSASGVINAFFTSYDMQGGLTDHTNIASDDNSGGYTSSLSPEISYIVDNYAAPMNIVVNLGNVNVSTLRFCGVRIAYYPYTEMIFKNSFE